MYFELNIKNVGKLEDAKIRIGQFTVFAGPNNTGKSFVSKVLYSLFSAMNANHAEVYINNLTRPLMRSLNRMIRLSEDPGDSPLYPLMEKVEKMETIVKEVPIGNFEELDKIIPDLVDRATDIRKLFTRIRRSLNPPVERNTRHSPPSLVIETLQNIDQSSDKLHKYLMNIDAVEFIASGIEYKIRENLIQNFQVPNLSDLRGREDTSSEVDIENFGKFKFENGNVVFNIDREWLRQLQQHSNVIYLESPVYWKLKNALENLRISPRYWRSGRQQISGVPGYFYDLASTLKYEYTGEIAFPKLYERLTGQGVIGGKIAISENGKLSFQEDDRSFSLPVTAMGVANLGILALLIERKVLDEDTFLFIDEPEAHLHPAWQVVMAETLFELAKGGVNVVIATHSADILKWLEVHVKKHPEDEGRIALNKFPVNGRATDEQDFRDKIAAIKQELTKPFADLYTAGL